MKKTHQVDLRWSMKTYVREVKLSLRGNVLNWPNVPSGN